jgi:hypothetical protein
VLISQPSPSRIDRFSQSSHACPSQLAGVSLVLHKAFHTWGKPRTVSPSRRSLAQMEAGVCSLQSGKRTHRALPSVESDRLHGRTLAVCLRRTCDRSRAHHLMRTKTAPTRGIAGRTVNMGRRKVYIAGAEGAAERSPKARSMIARGRCVNNGREPGYPQVPQARVLRFPHCPQILSAFSDS